MVALNLYFTEELGKKVRRLVYIIKMSKREWWIIRINMKSNRKNEYKNRQQRNKYEANKVDKE